MSNIAEEGEEGDVPLLCRREMHTKRCRKSRKNCAMIKTDLIAEGSSFELAY